MMSVDINIKILNAENVFLPLSVFFRYEIPIERKFLEKQMGIEDGIIEDLIGLQEIVVIEEIRKPIMLSLNHSSIADLYYKAYHNYPDFGGEIKARILTGKDEIDLEYCSFYRYITTTDSRNAVDIVKCLGRYWEEEKDNETLLNKLIEIDKIQEIILNGIFREEDIANIGECVGIIARWNENVAMKLVDSVLLKIDTEEGIKNIGFCVGVIARGNENVAMKLVDSVLPKIDREEDIENIGFCVGVIAGWNENVAMKLVDNVLLKIDREEDIKNVGACVGVIARLNENVALKLVVFC